MAPEPNAQYPAAQLRAMAYQRNPNVFNGLRHSLSQLLSIARTFANQQKYDVTRNAFTAITRLLADYLSVRDGDLIMPTSHQAMMGSTDFQFDTVLTEVLEGVSSIFKGAIARSDAPLSLQIIEALENLAVQSVNTKTLIVPPGENPTTAFVRGFLFGPGQEGAIRGLDDVTSQEARAQVAIGKALLNKGFVLTARGAISDVEKLAYIAIAQRKPHVTGVPVRGLADLLAAAVLQADNANNVIRAAMMSLQEVCETELQFKTPPLSLDLKFALGPYLDMTEATSLPHTEAVLIDKLASAIKEKNWGKVDVYRRTFEELNGDLWSHLVAIGTAAAKSESFALFWVNANIGEIARQWFWLHRLLKNTKVEAIDQESYHQQWLHEQFSDDLEKALRWIIGGTYSRIFDAFASPIQTNLVWDFFPTLSDIGIRAVESKLPSVAQSAIESVRSIALKCLEKPIQGLTSAPKVAVHIARIGIIAQKLQDQEILAASVNALKEFERKYLSKQREMRPNAETYDVGVPNEISELARDLRRRDPLMNAIDAEDATFFQRVTPEDIESFGKLLD